MLKEADDKVSAIVTYASDENGGCEYSSSIMATSTRIAEMLTSLCTLPPLFTDGDELRMVNRCVLYLYLRLPV